MVFAKQILSHWATSQPYPKQLFGGYNKPDTLLKSKFLKEKEKKMEIHLVIHFS